MYTNINEMRPKYESLDNMLMNYTSNVSYSNNVNIIVDLKECFRKAFRYGDFDSITYDDLIESVVGDIVNMLGHWRNYFYKNFKYTTFFVIYSEKQCDKFKALDISYKSKWYEKYQHSGVSDMVKACLAILKDILVNVPHCNYIDVSDYDEHIYTKYILENHPRDLNVILSNDYTLFDLLGKNNVLVNCKMGDACTLVNEKNAIATLTKDKYSFSNKLVPLFLAISGYDKYSIDGIRLFGAIKSAKLINDLLESSQVFETEYYKINFDLMFNKYICENIDLVKKNYSIFMPIDLILEAEKSIINKCVNIDTILSMSAFQEINSQMFTNNILDLQKLFAGEQVDL